MSKSPLSPFWSRNPNIPIYLDSGDEHGPQQLRPESEHTCPTCETSSRNQPIHCVTIASPAPPSYRSIASPVPPSYGSVVPPARPSRNLSVPGLNLQTSRLGSRPQRPRPALRAGAEGRPHVRLRRSTLSPISPCTTISDFDFNQKSRTSGASIPNTPEDDFNHMRKSKLGLGIADVPFQPDPSPIRSPGGEKLAKAEAGESIPKSSPNVAERIEAKLWKYSASGNVAKRWLLEIVSWMLSAACMSAIIIALFVLKDKPVPNWPLGLTLNAFIAVVSKIASAALLLPAAEALGQLKWNWFQGDSKKMWDFEIFDNASRGPWGSFLLLVRTKGRSLAALGAAITIFAMALDPFFQQVVHYPERWQLQTLSSSVPRVVNYTFTHERDFADGPIAPGPLANGDKDMTALVDKFFLDYGVPEVPFGNGTRTEIPLFCPTSNCTWDSYQTLGVCSACTDVADMLDFGCVEGPMDWIHTALPSSSIPYDNGTMCGWFFNITGAKPMLMSGYTVNNDTNQTSEILTTRLLPLTTNINRRPIFNASINYQHIRHRVADFVVVTAPDGPDYKSQVDSIFAHKKPKAHECMLSWCVKTLESSYFEGTYTENVKDTFLNATQGPFPWTQYKVEPPPKDIPDAVFYRYLENVTVVAPTVDGGDDTSMFLARNESVVNIIYALDDYLPGVATAFSNVPKITLKYRTWEDWPYFREYTNQPFAVGAPNNLTYHMERLATTMTNLMRQNSTDNVTGKAFSTEVYVEVRWEWLSLPLGLLLTTLIFLLATIIRTSIQKDQVGVWKTSAIATLLYGLPDEMQKKIVASQADGSQGTPRTKAKQLKVKMLPKQGWRVSGHLLSPAVPRPKPQPPPGWI